MNKNKLKGKIIEKGLNLGKLCFIMNISRPTLTDKANGKRDFTRKEISDLISILELTEEETFEIFFKEGE